MPSHCYYRNWKKGGDWGDIGNDGDYYLELLPTY